MRFERVTATAFGCLQAESLDFAPGFTVLFGLNEAGKSTWHAAMYAALCGVRRGPGSTSQESEFKTRYTPWGSVRWDVGATIALDNGGCIDLHHDLAGKIDCRAVDGLGRDISAELMFEGMPDGSTLLGLNRNLYPQVGCIRQAEILGLLKEPHALHERLQRTVASPDAKATVTAALKALTEFKADRVGQATKNAVKPLARSLRAKADTEQRLSDARRSHSEYSQMVATAGCRRVEAVQARAHSDRLEAQMLLVESAALAKKVARMLELQRRLPNGPPADSEIEDERAIEVARVLRAWEERPTVALPLDGQTAEELTRELASLAEPPGGDAAPHSTVVEAEQAWRSAAAVLADHAAAQPPLPLATGSAQDAFELRELAAALQVDPPPISPELEREVALARQRVANASAPTTRTRFLVGGGALLALVGLAAFLLNPALGAVAVLAGLAVAAAGVLSRSPSTPLWRAVEEQTRAEASLAMAQAERSRCAEQRARAVEAAQLRGIEPTPVHLLREAEALERGLLDEDTRRNWELRQARLLSALDSRSQALRDALAARGASASGYIEAGLRRYKDECVERSEQSKRAAARPALEAQLNARREFERTSEENHRRALAARRALGIVTGELALPRETEETAAASLRRWQADRRKRQEADETSRREWQELEALVSEGSPDELKARIAKLEARAAALNPMPNDAPTLPCSDPRSMLEEASAAASLAESAATSAEARCAEFARTAPSVSEAEEAFEAAIQELAAVQTLGAVLERTTTYLAAAEEQVQRNIAPVLVRLVEDRLQQVTGGRYQRIAVDPGTLAVSVVDSTGNHRPARNLSHGTAEQVYLLLRVALAEHFGNSGESVPLLMDDVTVESDSVRKRAILEVLHEVSAAHQVVLFTQEEEVLAWAQSNLTGPRDRWQQLPERRRAL
ncbi:MAG: AAA family ATPase [Tepidiformaceae bacterium]